MLKNKVALGAVWLFFGKFLSHLIALGGFVIIAGFLTPEDVGLVGVTMAMMSIIAAAADMPVSMALIQLKDPEKHDFDTAFTLSLIRGVVVTILISAAAIPVAMIYNEPRYTPLMFAIAVYPLLLSFRNPNFERKARAMKFSFEFSMMLTAKIVSFLLTVAIAYYTRSYWALIIGQLAFAAVQAIMTYVLCPIFPWFSLKSWKKLFNFSVWLGLGWFVNQLNWRADMLMVGGLPDKNTKGHYSYANQITNETIQMINQAASKSLFSAFSLIQTEPDRVRRGYLTSQRTVFALIAPIALGLAATADWLIPLLFSPQWYPMIMIIQFSAPIAALMSMVAPANALAMSMDRTKELFFRDLFGLGVRLPMLVYGLMFHGLVGILLARAAAGVVMALVNMGMSKRYIQLSFWKQFSNVLRPMLCGFIMLGVVFGMRQIVPYEGGWLADLTVSLPKPEYMQKLIALMLVAGTGALAYVIASILTWHMAGRPEGLESRLGGAFGKVMSKIKGKPAEEAA